jgi:hypothetical protein
VPVKALVALTSLELVYASNPMLVDTRGAVATTPGATMFATYQLWPDAVTFEHPVRDARIGLAYARLFQVGGAEWEQALDFLFAALKRSSLQRIIGNIRLNRYFAVEDSRPFDAILVEQIQHTKIPSIAADGFGKIVDIATILSLERNGYIYNIQMGPQLRDHWLSFGGPKMASVIPTMPAVGWAFSFYPPVNWSLDMDLDTSKRFISKTLSEWETMVEQNVLRQTQ